MLWALYSVSGVKTRVDFNQGVDLQTWVDLSSGLGLTFQLLNSPRVQDTQDVCALLILMVKL